MEFTMIQIIVTGVALLVLGAILRSLVGRKGGEGFFSRIFQTNKDLDSTLDRVSITTIIIFMLISFHDDFTDPTKAAQITIIFLALIHLYQAMITGKTVRDMQNGHNGKGGADE